MTDPVIRLDRSKTFSECRGERTPEDPQYRVCYWQGSKVGNRTVLLPFDAQGLLVPDDGKTTPWPGVNVENKPVEYHPLYDQHMRALVERKMQRMAVPAAQAAELPHDDSHIADDQDLAAGAGDEVNLVSWLRGEVQYQPHQLRTAVKNRYHRNIQNISDIVVDLVLDEKLVPEDQICAPLARYLPKVQAA